MADWYVFQHDAEPLGPWSTEVIAQAILEGRLAPDIWVAAPGGPRWLRALDVPFIARLVEGLPTKPRRDSGMRIIPNPAPSPTDVVNFGETMIVDPAELELDETPDPPTLPRDLPRLAGEDDDVPTDRDLPPPSPSTPDPPPPHVGGGATLESVGNTKK